MPDPSARLTEEARIAITMEHQRDHDDGPNEPREGCLGCRLLTEIDALNADLAALRRERGCALDRALTSLEIAHESLWELEMEIYTTPPRPEPKVPLLAEPKP